MIIVLNEWIFHDLLGQNGVELQRETSDFVNALFYSDDALVLPDEPRWMRKAYQLMATGNPELRAASIQLHTLMQTSRVIDVRAMERRITPPPDLRDRLPEEDIYLVEAYLSASADALVTTDCGLHGALADFSSVDCSLRRDFLAGYFRRLA